MRILLLTHYYHPEIGPPQLRWGALVRDFVDAGHQVQVIAPAPHYPLGDLLPGEDPGQVGTVSVGEHGEQVHRVAFRKVSPSARSALLDQLVAAAHTVATAWRRRSGIDADVLIATVPGLPTLLAGRILAAMLGVPYVLEMRDAWPDLLEVVGRSGRRSPQRWLRSRVVAVAARAVTRAQRRADLVVTTTTSLAGTLRSRGVPAVLTVRNAPRALPRLPRPGAQAPGLRIVYVGVVGRAQGLETALQALRMVGDAGVEASMRVVGTGARVGAVQELARDLEVPVSFVGPVPREQLSEHYSWASTFLVILRDWPGLRYAVPSKLYEALGLGLHVSASLSGEAADIVRETEAGLVVPPEDPAALAGAWIELARRPQTPDPSAARAWLAEHASEEIASTRYLQALHRLVPREQEVPST